MLFLSQSIATHLDRIRVQWMFEKLSDDWLLVVPDRSAMRRVHNARGIPMRNMVPSGIPTGEMFNLTLVREWMFKHLIPPNERYVIVNDNIYQLTQVDPIFYSGRRIDFDEYDFDRRDWTDMFNVPCQDVMAVIVELFDKMEEMNTVLGGIGGMENYFYRKYKWADKTLVRGDFFVGVNDEAEQNPGRACPTWDDWWRTLNALDVYGKVVVNRWVMVKKPECEAGGLGPEESRTEAKRQAAKFLAGHFPHIVEIHKKRDDALTIRRGKWQR